MEREVLICRPDDGSYVYPGSVQDKCGQCGVTVWISPATLKEVMQVKLNIDILCAECALREIKPGEIEIKMTPGQILEVKTALGRN